MASPMGASGCGVVRAQASRGKTSSALAEPRSAAGLPRGWRAWGQRDQRALMSGRGSARGAASRSAPQPWEGAARARARRVVALGMQRDTPHALDGARLNGTRLGGSAWRLAAGRLSASRLLRPGVWLECPHKLGCCRHFQWRSFRTMEQMDKEVNWRGRTYANSSFPCISGTFSFGAIRCRSASTPRIRPPFDGTPACPRSPGHACALPRHAGPPASQRTSPAASL